MSPAAGLARTIQSSFAAGMYRNGSPELDPPDAIYDGTNCLLDLLGGVFKRGGTSYRSSEGTGLGLLWVWDGTLAKGGQQTLVGSLKKEGYGSFARLASIGGGFTDLAHGGVRTPIKPAVFQNRLYFPGGDTFDGETWATCAKVGEHYTTVANRLIVATGKQIWASELKTPPEAMPNPPAFAANEYVEVPEGVTILGLEAGRDSCVVFTTGGVWVVSGLAGKLTDATGNVQWRLDHFSSDLVLWGAGGVAGWEGNLIVPGTDAVWLINRGVTSEVVRSFSRLSDQIRDLYREYVRRGCIPGQACVHENHYILPILGAGSEGGEVVATGCVDVLVCRLDTPGPHGRSGAWTHFAGYGAGLGACTTRVVPGKAPELLGGQLYRGPSSITGAPGPTRSRALTLSYFTPGETNTTDADGSVPAWALETRSFPTGNTQRNLVARLRARYQMWMVNATPQITLQVAGDEQGSGTSTWGAFTWGSGYWGSPAPEGEYEAVSGTAGPDPRASTPYSWRLHRKVRFIRFRLSSPDATAALALKTLETFIRPAGRP